MHSVMGVLQKTELFLGSTLVCPSLHLTMCVCVCVCVCVTFLRPMNCNPPGSSTMESFRQDYWSGYPFPSLGNLLDPGLELRSIVLQADSL